MSNENPPRYVVKTLGCKANLYDSQMLEGSLRAQGWSPYSHGDPLNEVSLCIVNSCTVTDEADKQSRKLAEKLARDFPRAKIVYTGCSAEVNPQQVLNRSKGIDYVLSNRDKPQFLELLKGEGPQLLGDAKGYEELRSQHPMDREWPLPDDLFWSPQEGGLDSARTRAFLKVQEGCNSFCTYCIIPYGRGPSRSLRPQKVVEQIRYLIDRGIREIVLTGTNIGDYGVDWEQVSSLPRGEALAELVDLILAHTSLERLRISSLDPVEITDSLCAIMNSSDRLCSHFHVSLQSPSSKILKLMKRKYSFKEVEACLERIQKISAPPGGVFVGMDLITGFPGETEEDFEWTYDTLSQLPWTRIHVFPYSEREGTPATRIHGNVPPAERKRRSRALAELSLQRQKRHYEKMNSPLLSVLIEGEQRGPDGSRSWMGGYTSNYLRVLVKKTPQVKPNDIVSVTPETVVVDKKSQDVVFLSQLQVSHYS